MLQEREAFEVPPDVPDTSRAVTPGCRAPPGSLFRENTQTNHLRYILGAMRRSGAVTPTTSSVGRRQTGRRSNASGSICKARVAFVRHGRRGRALTDTLTVLRRRSALHGLDLLPVEDVPHDNVTRVPLDDISWIEHEPLDVVCSNRSRTIGNSMSTRWSCSTKPASKTLWRRNKRCSAGCVEALIDGIAAPSFPSLSAIAADSRTVA